MLLTIASILLAPLIAMQFSTEVQWTAGDFIIAAILLSSFALLIEFLIRKKQQGKRRTHPISRLYSPFYLYVKKWL